MRASKTVLTLGVLLFASLSANAFFVGEKLGGQARVATVETGAPSARDDWRRREGELRARLSAADQKILEDDREQNRARFDALRAALEDARRNVRAALADDGGDAAALESAIAAEVAAKVAFMRDMGAARRAVMEKLSPEGRDILQKHKPFARPRDRHPPHDGGEPPAPPARMIPDMPAP